MIVSFASRVMELHLRATGVDRELLAERFIGAHGVARQEPLQILTNVETHFRTSAAKLALINRHIPAIGGVVAINANVDIFMTNHMWLWCANIFCVLGKSKTSANVVGVSVCVDKGANR